MNSRTGLWVLALAGASTLTSACWPEATRGGAPDDWLTECDTGGLACSDGLECVDAYADLVRNCEIPCANDEDCPDCALVPGPGDYSGCASVGYCSPCKVTNTL